MKIIFSVHQFFPKYYTGTERYVLNLATMMQKFGHQVSVITYQPGYSNNIEYRKIGELLVSNYTFQTIPVTSIKCQQETDYTSFDLNNSNIEKYFSSYLSMQKPDILHIAHPMRMASAFWAAKKLNIKTILTLTDYWLLCGKGILLRNNNLPCTSPNEGKNCKKYCYQHLSEEILKSRVDQARKIFIKSDGLIASAQYLVDMFAYNKYDISNLTLIRHGFNFYDNFTPLKNKSSKTFTIVSTGTLLPHKGAHLLIESFRKIKNKNMRLKIYGTTYGNNEYMDQLLRLKGNDSRISFNGGYSIDMTAQIHQEADVVVQPSMWYETYPLVCVAALAYGVPIIVPDLTGAAELVEKGKNGFIFKFGNVESLTEQLELAYKEKLKKYSNVFYSQSIESEAVATEKLYYQIIN